MELLIAMLIMAIAVSGVMGTALQGAAQGGRLQRREQGALQVQRVIQALKNYVTADHSAATAAEAPDGCWNFRDAQKACLPGWALDEDPASNPHDLSFLLPAEQSADLGQPRYQARLSYTVRIVDGLPQATVDLSWVEP